MVVGVGLWCDGAVCLAGGCARIEGRVVVGQGRGMARGPLTQEPRI